MANMFTLEEKRKMLLDALAELEAELSATGNNTDPAILEIEGSQHFADWSEAVASLEGEGIIEVHLNDIVDAMTGGSRSQMHVKRKKLTTNYPENMGGL